MLAERAGKIYSATADGNRARETKLLGMCLDALLDEQHPHPTAYGSAVERMVRRMAVLEESTALPIRERGAFQAKKLAFIESGGNTPS